VRDTSYFETRSGNPYLRLMLEDMSGDVLAYTWCEEIYKDLYLPDYSLAYVEGQSRFFDNSLRLDLRTIQPQRCAEAGEVVRLIPQSLCPLPWLLRNLHSALNLITLPPLKAFVARVLSDDGISFAFVSAPARLNHHHGFPGGLLMHSLECFSMIEGHREFRKESYELGLVASLFHDIGKILTLTYNMRRTSLGYSLDHDKLTLEVLAPYLKRLDQDWPKGAEALRYCLTWKLKSQIPKYGMAELVACCDRISAGLDHQKGRVGGRRETSSVMLLKRSPSNVTGANRRTVNGIDRHTRKSNQGH
jgi:3'-5' exoribonuclease